MKTVTVYVVLFIAFITIIVFFLLNSSIPSNMQTNSTDPSLSKIILPNGFHISIFAEGLGNPRMMLFKDGTVYVSLTNQGRVMALPDKNNDGKADEQITFIDGLDKPHGLEYYNGWFYIAEETRVIRVRDDNKDNKAGSLEVVADLPDGGHATRTIKIYDNSLYISIGSSCNVCYEKDDRRAAILKCSLEGACKIFAKGLRNAVGFVFHDGKMYATENGRDLLGEDAPPDEINVVEEGKDYGWPLCYGDKIHDIDFDKNPTNPCEVTVSPIMNIQAHSAPLGLAFYSGNAFPSEYSGNMFVAYHGSWNRKVPAGYKIVRITPANEIKDFATGWLQSNVIGRPVDIIVVNGSLLVSDDFSGKIYRIWYAQ